jgi:hypothetical protein
LGSVFQSQFLWPKIPACRYWWVRFFKFDLREKGWIRMQEDAFASSCTAPVGALWSAVVSLFECENPDAWRFWPERKTKIGFATDGAHMGTDKDEFGFPSVFICAPSVANDLSSSSFICIAPPYSPKRCAKRARKTLRVFGKTELAGRKY